jgi:hypothetical protein
MEREKNKAKLSLALYLANGLRYSRNKRSSAPGKAIALWHLSTAFSPPTGNRP